MVCASKGSFVEKWAEKMDHTIENGQKAAAANGSLFGSKFIDGGRVVAPARFQNHRRKFRLIRRIGKVLGFQAECSTALISLAALPVRSAIEKISGIKLHARLRGPNFQHAPGVRFD